MGYTVGSAWPAGPLGLFININELKGGLRMKENIGSELIFSIAGFIGVTPCFSGLWGTKTSE